MEFVNIDNELTPRVMYKPYIYSTITPISIGYICKTPKGYKTFITPGAYEKGDDVLVRDPNRIEPFMQELGKIWKENVPDWRFSQLIENVFGEMKYVPWMLEEDRMLEEFHNYFEEHNGSGRIRRTTNEKTRKEKKKCQKLLNMVNIQKRINTLVKSVGVNLNIGIMR